MSVVIRMARRGAKKRAIYRIVAADERFANGGRFLENLGTFDPHQNPAAFTIKDERVDHWLAKGARITDTVKSLRRSTKNEDK